MTVLPRSGGGRVPAILMALWALSGCSELVAPLRVATVTIAPTGATLLLGPSGGQSVQLTATTRSADGNVLAGRSIVWSVDHAGIASVTPTGLVTALGVGTTTVRATVESRTATVNVLVEPVPIAAIDITTSALVLQRTPLQVGSAQVVAVAFDSTGAVLPNRALNWQSSNPLVVGVSNLGAVTAIGAGTAYVIASANLLRDSVAATVTVDDVLPTGFDVSITSAQWTQASQTAEGSIPMLLGGRAAVVNVMTSAPAALVASTILELRLFGPDGAQRWSTRRTATIPAGSTTATTPTIQFLVPSVELAPDLQWDVLWNPDGGITDADATTDRYPRTQRGALAVVQPPSLKLRFVPVSLVQHGSVTGAVSSSNVEEYLRVIRQFAPVGDIQYSIAPAFASDATFGVGNSGGGSAFWTSLLQQLDITRVASPEHADAHWVGVVRPPAGFNNSEFGGYAFIPGDGASFGPGTRTFGVVSAGWFFRESATRELMMHELGHNLGRRHAPCNGAASVDPIFPDAGGRAGDGGHDTYSFQRGVTGEAYAVPANHGDTMGYCTPVWISTYSYDAMLQFRGQQIVALQEATVRQPAIVVHGITDETGVATLQRAVVMEGVASMSPDAGDWEVRLYDANRLRLASRRFTLGRLDHLEGRRPIAVAIPLGGIDAARVTQIEVRSPSGRTSTIALQRNEP